MNSAYLLLLAESGVCLSDEERAEFAPSPPPSPPHQPSSDYWQFAPGTTMLNTEDKNGIPYGVEWNDWTPPRRVHRYSREYRFRSTVAQLLGLSFTKIPAHVVDEVRQNLKCRTPARIWNGVRKILRKNGWRRYYLEIPSIISRLSGQRWKTRPDTVKRVMEWFAYVNQAFNSTKKNLNRKYFPPMQYMALRLLQEQCGAVPPYRIPVARTVRKRTSLALIYDSLLLDSSLPSGAFTESIIAKSIYSSGVEKHQC